MHSPPRSRLQRSGNLFESLSLCQYIRPLSDSRRKSVISPKTPRGIANKLAISCHSFGMQFGLVVATFWPGEGTGHKGASRGACLACEAVVSKDDDRGRAAFNCALECVKSRTSSIQP